MSRVTINSENIIDLEDILDKFNVYGCYFMKIAFLMCLIFLTNNIYSCNYIFATEKTSYRCKNQSINNSGHIFDDCKEWVYDNPHTFVAEFQLANQEWKRTLVGTTHCFGYMVGLLFVGPLSDRLGRKNAIVVTAVLGGVLGVARSFSPWYWLYIALEFLEAAIGDPGSPAYILITELVSKKYRIIFIMISTFGCVLGGFVTALVAWLVPYWRYFLRVVYTPALLFVFYKYILSESPRWLLIKGKKEEAIEILKTIAKSNNTKLDNLEKLSCEEIKEEKFQKILKDTLQSKLLRRRFFVCVIWWITSTFVNYGLSINSVLLQGNKYLNYAFISLLEVPGIFILTYILTHCNRKLPLMCCFTVSAILCISQPFMPSNLTWLSVIVYVSGKLFSWFFFEITYLYTSELFPTHTRNSMHALCSSIGRIGSMTAPQTQLLMAYWFGLPQMLFGMTSLIAAGVTLLVPDVSNEALPDTVKQAEAMGKTDYKKSEIGKYSSTDVSRL
ncbi:PREDICTED: solute carrier family 22 member 2-like [Papilio xuthus]|uniref:Solute carrier family 22 member 2-like n=1 Tax=Papilio xuthus TaxID=66420 RepID=A0AAJ7E3R5_PAPXU|nr:PREDICTED: solute carrier family 22 member 2-like [Papilio xuthus]